MSSNETQELLKIMRETFDEVVAQRSKYSFTDDNKYYYFRGQQAAIAAMTKFVLDGGGSFRTLVYDYLNNMEYSDVLDAGGLAFSNKIYEYSEKNETQELQDCKHDRVIYIGVDANGSEVKTCAVCGETVT